MKTTIIIIVSLLIGVVSGYFFGMKSVIFDTNNVGNIDTARMGQVAICLTMLRKNEDDMAIETLEVMLDSDLVTLAGQIRAGRTNLIANKGIQIVKEYRFEHPRRVDKTVDSLVEEVLGTNGLNSTRQP
jgi:hypothetical protein